MTNFFAITLTLFFVMDALGNIPTYLQLIKPFDKKKQRWITLREFLFALAIMVLFNYVGEILLSLLGIKAATVQVAGGIVLFLISIRLIFSHEDQGLKWKDQEPFVVPIATPLIAGPSVLAIIMIFAQEEPSPWIVVAAIFVAWILTCVVFVFAQPIFKLVKAKGLDACQRLMGLIVALIAVQLFLKGISGTFR